METCIFEVKPYLQQVLKAGLLPFLHGSPGIGKSSLLAEIASEFNLEVIDLRLSQCEPTDLMGFPCLEGTKATYKPMDFFPVEGDPLPEGKNGWLLALDEMNGADESVQKAAYKLVLDKMVGNHKLHKNIAIVAAGNLATDRAMVEDMSTALQSRMVHFPVTVKPQNWLKWAASRVDYRIAGFIGFRPEKLNGDVEHEDFTFPCCRTWTFLSSLIKDVEDIEFITKMATATIGEGTAREFVSFLSVYASLPSWNDIITNSNSLQVPTELSTCFALASLIAHRVDDRTITPVVTFIKRMDIEVQIVTLKLILGKNHGLQTHQAITGWVKENANLLEAIS
jgi:hypothetical protein